MHKPTLQLTALRDDNAVLNSTKGCFWFVAVLLTLALASQYNGRETRMYHTRKSIEEHEATIEIQDSDMGLTFFSGSSPPRIQKIDIFSYFFGWLFPGDWILQIDNRGSNIIVSYIEPSSVAAQFIFPGDILLDVNGKEVNNDVSAAKKAIRQSIIEKKNVVLRLERDGPPLKLISTPAEDVVEILTRAKGFWNKRCRLIPIEEEEPRKLKKVYHAPNVESEPFPVDDTGKKLVATPSRDGGTRTEEPVETAEEEPATTEEEEF
uniref:PDZ domain-containing protein n=1 Tax=Meloidogyne javanica TaxID=6303 RepID=A0A915MUS7_MELJA